MNTPHITVNPNGYKNFYISRKRNTFNDKRLENVWLTYEKRLASSQSSIIEKTTKNNAEAIAIERFLNNPRVTTDELIKKSCEIPKDAVKGQRLIVYGDTSTLSLKKQSAYLEDIESAGYTDDNKTRGYHAHVNLVANQKNGHILGLSDIILYMRRKRNHINKGQKELERRNKKFKEKEAYKWVLGVHNSLRTLESAEQVLFVFDSDADSFDIFHHLKNEEKTSFIIRGSYNRFVIANGKKVILSEALSQKGILGCYDFKVPKLNHRSKSRKRVTRKKRKASIELRVLEVEIAPTNWENKQKGNIKLTLVEAREVNKNLPKGEKPVLWRLWTTKCVKTFDDAREIIEFYRWRWNIEQLFRIVKKKGFALQSTKLKTFSAITKQAIMVLKSASLVLQLIKAREKKDSQPIDEVFTKEEIVVLKKLNKNLEGRTKLLKNNNPPDRLSWGAWIIARLGGWKGYTSRGKPGPTTFKRGLEKYLVYLDASRIL